MVESKCRCQSCRSREKTEVRVDRFSLVWLQSAVKGRLAVQEGQTTLCFQTKPQRKIAQNVEYEP